MDIKRTSFPLEKESLDQILVNTGGLVQEFRIKKSTLIIWMVFGVVMILIGIAGILLITNLMYDSFQAVKPEDKLTFQQRIKVGSILLLLIGLIYFGSDRIKHSRKMLGSRILLTNEALLYVTEQTTKIFPWKELKCFRQDRIKGTNEKHPGYPAMNRDMKCSILRIDGEQFDYDFDTIENHQALTRLIYDALKGTDIPWEFQEKS